MTPLALVGTGDGKVEEEKENKMEGKEVEKKEDSLGRW